MGIFKKMPFFGRKKQIPEVHKEASIDLQDIISSFSPIPDI